MAASWDRHSKAHAAWSRQISTAACERSVWHNESHDNRPARSAPRSPRHSARQGSAHRIPWHRRPAGSKLWQWGRWRVVVTEVPRSTPGCGSGCGAICSRGAAVALASLLLPRRPCRPCPAGRWADGAASAKRLRRSSVDRRCHRRGRAGGLWFIICVARNGAIPRHRWAQGCRGRRGCRPIGEGGGSRLSPPLRRPACDRPGDRTLPRCHGLCFTGKALPQRQTCSWVGSTRGGRGCGGAWCRLLWIVLVARAGPLRDCLRSRFLVVPRGRCRARALCT